MGAVMISCGRLTVTGREPELRRSFITAAKPPLAVDASEMCLAEMNRHGRMSGQHGEFGADMQVSLVNEGPCTIVIDTDEWKKKE